MQEVYCRSSWEEEVVVMLEDLAGGGKKASHSSPLIFS
jgi:hypothetical protein